MDNEILQRIRQLISQLKATGIITTQRELAQQMGYKSAVAFSQITTGHTRLPRKFVERLSALDPHINRTWIETGEGEMLLEVAHLSVPASATTQSQTQSPAESYDMLVRMLYDATCRCHELEAQIARLQVPTPEQSTVVQPRKRTYTKRKNTTAATATIQAAATPKRRKTNAKRKPKAAKAAATPTVATDNEPEMAK